MDLRAEAKRCLERARTLLDAGDDPSVRYACLELRFAIEYLMYAHAESCLAELGPTAAEKWTVSQIMEELLSADPTADRTREIAVGVQSEPGVAATTMNSLGVDRRIKKKTAIKMYSALGSFVHAPTLAKLRAGEVASFETMRRKADEVVTELDAVLASPVFHASFRETLHFKCGQCDEMVSRNMEAIKDDGGANCRHCGAEHSVRDVDGKSIATLKLVSMTCKQCGETQPISSHRVTKRERLDCPCGASYEVREGYVLVTN